jgi:hypothetical protein
LKAFINNGRKSFITFGPDVVVFETIMFFSKNIWKKPRGFCSKLFMAAIFNLSVLMH